MLLPDTCTAMRTQFKQPTGSSSVCVYVYMCVCVCTEGMRSCGGSVEHLHLLPLTCAASCCICCSLSDSSCCAASNLACSISTICRLGSDTCSKPAGTCPTLPTPPSLGVLAPGVPTLSAMKREVVFAPVMLCDVPRAKPAGVGSLGVVAGVSRVLRRLPTMLTRAEYSWSCCCNVRTCSSSRATCGDHSHVTNHTHTHTHTQTHSQTHTRSCRRAAGLLDFAVRQNDGDMHWY